MVADDAENQADPAPNPTTSNDSSTSSIHQIFYRNQYTDAYKIDERVLKQIVYSNVQCINPNDKLKLMIYYKNPTVKTILTKNDQSPSPSDLQKTNLVYEYTCKIGDCERLQSSYIGVTQTTLSRRLTMHKGSGAIKDHMERCHNLPLTRDALVNNTKILRTNNDTSRLLITEALLIHAKNPALNKQATGLTRTLKLHCSRPG